MTNELLAEIDILKKKLKELEKTNNENKKKLKAFDIIINHTLQDGMRSGWVIHFKDMSDKELKLVDEVLIKELFKENEKHTNVN